MAWLTSTPLDASLNYRDALTSVRCAANVSCMRDGYVQDLNVTSRALVLDALQQMKLSAHKKR